MKYGLIALQFFCASINSTKGIDLLAKANYYGLFNIIVGLYFFYRAVEGVKE